MLNLPTADFVAKPSNNELTQFFTGINYQGQVNLSKLPKNGLVAEWYLVFDTLIRVFANCAQTFFSNIPYLIQYIGYSIAYERKIDIGKILWKNMFRRIINAKKDFNKGSKVSIYYPRFFTLIFNHLVSEEIMNSFVDEEAEDSSSFHKRFHT